MLEKELDFIKSSDIYVEKLGTGIKRIYNSLAESGLPEPEIKFFQNSFYITLFDKNYNKDKKNTNAGVNAGVNDVRLSDNQVKIIKKIEENPKITINHLASEIKLNKRTVERNIKKMQELKILYRTGSDKIGIWKINK